MTSLVILIPIVVVGLAVLIGAIVAITLLARGGGRGGPRPQHDGSAPPRPGPH